MPAHGVLNYFIIFSSAHKNTDAWVLMWSFSIAVKGFEVER